MNEKTVELTIDSLAYGGSGVGRSGGKVYFIPWTVPGDKVEIRVTRDKKRFAFGEIFRLIEPSPSRIEPFCPHFGSCGGCQWQNIPYEMQLTWKRSIVMEALQRMAKIEPPDITVIPSPMQRSYRSRTRMKIDSRGETGYFGTASHTLIPVTRCPICTEEVNHQISALQDEIERLKKTGDRSDFSGEAELFVPETGEAGYSIRFSSGENVRHSGSDLYFSQVNDGVNTLLIETIRTRAEAYSRKLKRDLSILDLYCGDGNLSLPLAESASRITGIDSSRTAIGTAQTRAEELNRGKKVRFTSAKISERSVSPLTRDVNYDLMILDPPRKGLEKNASFLSSLKIPFVIYVSCNPPQGASDLKHFTEAGYRLNSAVLPDMFPRPITANVFTNCRYLMRNKSLRRYPGADHQVSFR